jgi:2-polyprenyl-6-methoxyphenol hydroxylase-like FAD-dependent oxidoreductase
MRSLRMRPLKKGFALIGSCHQWNAAFSHFESGNEDVTVYFDDGSSSIGKMLVACDGGSSRARRTLFPRHNSYTIPIRVMGLKVDYTVDQIKPLRKLDPFFLQGTASENNSYAYFSSESNFPSRLHIPAARLFPSPATRHARLRANCHIAQCSTPQATLPRTPTGTAAR